MSTNRTTVLLAIALVAVAVLAYFPVLGSGFLAWDDPDMVLGNEAVSGAPLSGLFRIWTEPVFLTYLPVTFTSLWFDNLLFGESASGYHIVNVLLHALSALALLLLVRRLGASPFVSVTAAFLFLVHPLATESVAWISERKGLLAFLFSMLSFLWFLKAVEGEKPDRRKRHAIGTGFLVLALLSKGTALVVPLFLLLYKVALGGDAKARPRGADLVPYAVVAVLLTALHYAVAVSLGPAITGGEGSTFARLVAGFPVLARYVRLSVVPIGQSIVPDLEPEAAFSAPLLLAAGVVAAYVAFLVVTWRRDRPVFFAMALLALALAPFNNVFPKTTVLFAERYAYFSIAGVALAAAFLLARLPKARVLAASGLVLLLLGLTLARTRVWSDGVEVFADAQRKNPGSWLAAMKHGDALDLSRRHEEAAVAYSRAVGNAGNDDQAVGASLAQINAHIAAGDKAEFVLDHIELVSRMVAGIHPDRRAKIEWEIESKRGWALTALSRQAEAVEAYRAAARSLPDEPLSYVNLCSSLARLGRMDEALEAGAEAVRLDPESEEAAVAYAEALVVAGRIKDAWRELERFLGNRPESVRAICLIGELDLALTRPKEAKKRFDAALVLSPSNRRAITGLAASDLLSARAAWTVGQKEKARALGRQAVERDPQSVRTYVFLATMAEDSFEADQLLTKAVSLPGGDAARSALAAHRIRVAAERDRADDLEGAARSAAGAFRARPAVLRGAERIEISGTLPRLAALADGTAAGRDLVLVGVVRFLAARYDDAEELLSKAYSACVAAGEGDSDAAGLALLYRGRSRTGLKRYSPALDDFSVVADLWPSDPEPPYHRCDAFLRAAVAQQALAQPVADPNTLFGGARSAAGLALSLDPEHLPSRLKQGEIEFAAGRYVDSIRIFDEVKKDYPEEVEPMLDIATLYRAHYMITADKTFLREALTELQTAVALEPSNARVRAMHGELLLLAGKAQEAADELRMAIAEDPGMLEARQSLARLLTKQARARLDQGGRENREKAKRSAESAISMQAKIAGPHLVLADIYRFEKDFAPALEQLEWAKLREPDADEVKDAVAEFHKDLGYAYLLKGRKKEALKEFEKAVRAESKNVDLGPVRILLGYDEATADGEPLDPVVERLLREKTEEARTWFVTAAKRRAEGDLDGAAEALLLSVKARTSAEAWVEIGRIRFDQRRMEDAEKAFRTGARLKPGLPEAHLGIGNVLYLADEWKGALLSYRNFLRTSAERGETQTRIRVQARVDLLEKRVK